MHMPKISEETREQVQEAVRHPVSWWKGAGLPEEKIRPWEYGIQFLSSLFPKFMDGFLNVRHKLFIGDAKNKVNYNQKSIADVFRTVWDGLNDPLIGLFMDRKNFGANIHRIIMRAAATVVPLLTLLQCFDLGLSPVQRLISWIVIDIFSNTFSTANDVSSAKIWAGITPHSEQRGRLQMFRSVGATVGSLFSGLPWIIVGFAPNFGLELSEYQVMIWGALLFAPITLFSNWMPSFAKQRVDFTTKIEGEDEAAADENGTAQPEHRLSLKENFAIVKHNRWFMMWLLIDFIRVLVPTGDRMFIYKFLIPGKTIFKKYFTGMALKTILDIVIEWPCFVLAPLGPRIVDRFGGPVKFIRLHMAVNLVTQIVSFAVGYKTWPRLITMRIMEMFRDLMSNWSPVAHNRVEYEMFDYVEWKTGYRSEGVTQSVSGILKKFIKDNAGNIIYNAVMDWTGFQSWDTPIEKQPPRFMNSIWPLLHVGPIFGEAVALIAIHWFKYPHDPKAVEADLIERRAEAQKAAAEMEQ